MLPVGVEATKGLAPGMRVALADAASHRHAILEVSDVYAAEVDCHAWAWFGTKSRDHPGIVRLLSRDSHFVGGAVTLLQRLPAPDPRYDLPPDRLRAIFAGKGWRRIVGFHSRNLLHRGHEHIQLTALERVHADGLFISPIVGRGRAGDFIPKLVLAGYQAMLDHRLYPTDRVVIGGFMSYPRFCGSREAVFTALCRKNMGCSHFIVGRDHTGVDDLYGADENRRLFERLGDIGIEPVFFEPIGYDPASGRYVASDNDTRVLPISGTAIR